MSVARKLAVALVAFMLAGGFTMIGGAADVVVHDNNVSVTEDTDTVWVEVDNNNTTSQANVTVDLTAYDENDTAVSGATETLTFTTANSTVDIQESTISLNATEMDRVEVVATLDDTTVPEGDVTVTSGTFVKTDGTATGGGFDFSSMSTTEYAVIGGVAIVGYLVFKEE